MADDAIDMADAPAPKADKKAWVFGASAAAVMWAFAVCGKPLGGALTALTVYAWYWLVSRTDVQD